MKDVAAHAGVSLATVSRALSGARAMSPDMQARVIASAELLGYQVNLLGRALRQQRLNLIGLVVPDLQNPFFGALAEHLAVALRAGGFDLLVSSSGGSVDTEMRGVQSFLGQQIRALIIIPSDEVDSAACLVQAQARVPTIQFDRRVPSVDVPFVGCDNAHGMRLIAKHLSTIDADDPRQVVYIGGSAASSAGHERHIGFLRSHPDALCLLGKFEVQWGRRAVETILARGITRATLVAAADVIALGALSALQTAGHRVPEDFRIVGFDGIGVTDFAHPELTTVRQPVDAMTAAIVQLIDEGEWPIAPGEWILQPEMLVGESSPERVHASPTSSAS